MSSSEASRRRPSHQSRCGVDPVSCDLRTRRTATSITRAQRYFEGRAEQDDASDRGATVLTLLPVQQRLVDWVFPLRLLKDLQELAEDLSHRPGWLSREFDQLLPTHSVDHNTGAPGRGPHFLEATHPTLLCNPSTKTAKQTKQRILHHLTHPKKVNFRQILPQHVRALQSGAAVKNYFPYRATSSADFVLFIQSSPADLPNGKKKLWFGTDDLLLQFHV